ncbi:MAG: DUF2892 domain-containing protein [Anaerolineae bacterium]|nr:DUF2892 domain-containing protein [Anaerolineae bacterium]
MRINQGNTDRTIRVIVGLIIAAAGLYFRSWLGLIAIVPLATAVVGCCPIYRLLGINTCPMQHRS